MASIEAIRERLGEIKPLGVPEDIIAAGLVRAGLVQSGLHAVFNEKRSKVRSG